jgi:hypothetical protein
MNCLNGNDLFEFENQRFTVSFLVLFGYNISYIQRGEYKPKAAQSWHSSEVTVNSARIALGRKV